MSSAISKTDLISDIVSKSPQIAGLLSEYGLVCTHCVFNRFDTLESGAQLHGLTEADINQLVKEINLQLESESPS